MSQIEGSAVHDIRDLVAATLKTNTDIPSVVVPDGFDIKSLESLQIAPSRIRQNTNLISPSSLIAYIQRFRDTRSVVFADKTKTRIVAVLDFHQDADNPHWGMHKAVYDCPFSDEWKAWSAADGNKMNQIDFAEFLENNIQNVAPVGDNYSGPSGTELLEMVLAFRRPVRLSSSRLSACRTEPVSSSTAMINPAQATPKSRKKSAWQSRLSIMARRTRSMRVFATACATVSWSSGIS